MSTQRTIEILSIVSLLATAAVASDAVDAKAQRPLPPVSARFASADNREVPSFRRHVVPLLGKLGCNGRACHGSFQGRGGFRLSLFGYDFKLDHAALLAGDEPRVNPRNPQASLILRKPTMLIPHEGGLRYKLDSWEHHLLLRWIQGGAAGVRSADPDLVRLQVSPPEIRFQKKGEQVHLKAVAHWSDGTSEDVTPLCRFQSNDEQIAKIDAAGVATAVEPGDSHAVAFYDAAVAPVPVMRAVSDLVGPRYPDVPAPTEIDRLVVHKLRKLGIVPSELCTDAEFLRRASLDVTGTLPTAAEAAAFLADKSADKRRRKVDELLERPAYAEWWTTRLCDMTGANDRALVNLSPLEQRGSQEWYEWILKRVRANMPYDKLVEGIVLATSRRPQQSYTEYAREMSAIYRKDSKVAYADRPGLTYYWARRNVAQPQQKALSFAYTFLGVRIQCAECHKHPFDQWTQDDYKDFTKFFARVRYGVAPSDKSEYDALLASIDAGKKRGNDLRREFPRLLAEGKTLPVDELFVDPARPRPALRKPRPQVPRPKAAPKTGAKPVQKTAFKIAAEENRSARKPVVAPRPAKKPRVARRATPPGDRFPTRARLLGGPFVELSHVSDPRAPLMSWLRSEKNAFFARAFVNRVWAAYFNVGIVNPPDNISLANPPSNAELLDYLASGFVEHHYDMKWLHREIVNSRTYQLSWHPNDTNRQDQRNFSHAVIRRLPAEVAYDAVRQATASDAVVKGMQAGSAYRAIGVASSGRPLRGGSPFALKVFGRSSRDSNCDCDRSDDPSLLQTVFLRNDGEVLAMLDDRTSGWVAQITAELQPKRPPAPRAGRRPVVAARPKAAIVKGDATPTKDRANTAAPRPDYRFALASLLGPRIAELKSEGNNERAEQLQRRLDDLKRELPARNPVVFRRPRPKGAAAQRGGPRRPVMVQLSAEKKNQLIRTAYLRTLSRYPDEREAARASAYLDGSKDNLRALRDLLWALVNTQEFIVNH